MTRTFVWTPQKERALELEWDGRYSQRRIAAELGVTRRTVEGWVRRTAFQVRLTQLADASRARWEREWRAQYGPKPAPSAQERAALEAKAKAPAEAWVVWKMACHAARAAHRKLPPMPPGLD